MNQTIHFYKASFFILFLSFINCTQASQQGPCGILGFKSNKKPNAGAQEKLLQSAQQTEPQPAQTMPTEEQTARLVTGTNLGESYETEILPVQNVQYVLPGILSNGDVKGYLSGGYDEHTLEIIIAGKYQSACDASRTSHSNIGENSSRAIKLIISKLETLINDQNDKDLLRSSERLSAQTKDLQTNRQQRAMIIQKLQLIMRATTEPYASKHIIRGRCEEGHAQLNNIKESTKVAEKDEIQKITNILKIKKNEAKALRNEIRKAQRALRIIDPILADVSDDEKLD